MRRFVSLVLLALLVIVTVTGFISWLLPWKMMRGKVGLAPARWPVLMDIHAWVGIAFLVFCAVHIYLNRKALKAYLGLRREG